MTTILKSNWILELEVEASIFRTTGTWDNIYRKLVSFTHINRHLANDMMARTDGEIPVSSLILTREELLDISSNSGVSSLFSTSWKQSDCDIRYI